MENLLAYLPWSWLGAVVVGGALCELLWYGVVVLRAADVDYDPARCASQRPAVDLQKALRRRVTWPRLGLPLFAICAALFLIQLLWMSLLTYTLISIAWYLTAPPRQMWGIAVSRRLRRTGDSYWTEVRRYYSAGLRMPGRPEEQVWFVGRYRWLNKFQNLWYVRQLYRFWAFPSYAVAALFWPVASAFSIFYHLERAGRPDYLNPWWRLDRDLAYRPAPHAVAT
jgi:hypothetical protein